MAISDQAGDNVDETVDGAAMASVFNLRDIFELVDDTLNDGPLS